VGGRARRRLTWLAALAAVAGVIAVLVAVVPNTGGKTEVAPATDSPQQHIEIQQKRLKELPPEARRVAGEFLLTALAREHLDRAWPIAGPEVREGMTYKNWLTGNIAVPVANGGVGLTHVSIDSLAPTEVWLRVLVDPAKAGKQFKPMVYSVRLNKIHRHWVVNELQPRIGVAIKHVE
jgi:hypothetical protein